MSVLRRTCFSGSAASTLAFRNCACEGLYGRSLAATSKGRGFHTTSFVMSKKSHKEMVERKKQQERQKEKLEERKKKKLKALKKKHKVATVAEELRPSDPLLESEVVIPPRGEGVLLDSDASWKIRKGAKLGWIPRPLPPEKTITRTELKELVDAQNPDVAVVDIRTAMELQFEPAVPGAVHVPSHAIEGWILADEDVKTLAGTTKPKKDVQIVVSGNPEDEILNIETVLSIAKAGLRPRKLINGHREWNKYYNPTNAKAVG